MSDGRCRFEPRAKHEMVSRLLAGEKARDRALDGVRADDGDHVDDLPTMKADTETTARDPGRWPGFRLIEVAHLSALDWAPKRAPVPKPPSNDGNLR